MKNYVARRLLVGALALTTLFSTFGSSNLFSMDGETVAASDYVSDDSQYSLKDISGKEIEEKKEKY